MRTSSSSSTAGQHGGNGDSAVRPGTIVSIHSMKGLSHLNGKEGTVVQYDEKKDRWSVRLHNGKTHPIKADNLNILGQSSVEEGPPAAAAAAGDEPEVLFVGPPAGLAAHAASPISDLRGLGSAAPKKSSRLDDHLANLERLAAEEKRRQAPLSSPSVGRSPQLQKPGALDNHLSALDQLAADEARRLAEVQRREGQRVSLERRAAPPPPEPVVPSLDELMAQLDEEEDGAAGRPGAARAGLSGVPYAYSPGRPLVHTEEEEDEGPADRATSSSLELVLARIDQDMEADDSRQTFFRLGQGVVEDEGPKDALAKMIRLTGAADPKDVLGRASGPDEPKPEDPAAAPKFQSRTAPWKTERSTGSIRPSAAGSGLMEEGALGGAGWRLRGNPAPP